eukprot:scaffold138138_cov28-Prasinocladus_malaysianus.AAC.1
MHFSGWGYGRAARRPRASSHSLATMGKQRSAAGRRAKMSLSYTTGTMRCSESCTRLSRPAEPTRWISTRQRTRHRDYVASWVSQTPGLEPSRHQS